MERVRNKHKEFKTATTVCCHHHRQCCSYLHNAIAIRSRRVVFSICELQEEEEEEEEEEEDEEEDKGVSVACSTSLGRSTTAIDIILGQMPGGIENGACMSLTAITTCLCRSRSLPNAANVCRSVCVLAATHNPAD
jgi:hypothetical protein